MSKTGFKLIGANNHAKHDRPDGDFYATDPRAIDDLLAVETFNGNIWEPACGQGHLSKRLEERGFNVLSTDITDRGFGVGGIDFLHPQTDSGPNDNIITNPPYEKAFEFLKKSLEILYPGKKLALFLRLLFLEGQKRSVFFKKFPPETVYVYSKRIRCAMNGDFSIVGSGASAYAWFVWRKGVKTETKLKWL